MEKLKIKIHPTFIIFACILIYFGKSSLFLIYMVTIFLHEFSHAFVARRLGYNIKNIKVLPFGICLNINSFDITPKDEIKIALAGPFFNFFISLFFMSFWWIFPESYNYTYLFCYANFITMIFNLIPAFPLDGGRIFLSLLKQKIDNKLAVKNCKIINIIISIILLSLFIFSCFNQINFTYLFVVFCILSGIFDKNEIQKYSIINFNKMKKTSKIVKIKPLFVNVNEKLYKVCRYIDNFSYLKIYISDDEKNIIAILSEKQFLNLMEQNNSTDTFKIAFNKKFINQHF